MIAAQKDYARRMLSRTNPYRKMTYAADPAIAFVEITNENSLFMWSAPRILPNLPDFYRNRLEKRFNDWLQKKYGDDEALKAAWEKDNVPLEKNLITNPTLQIDRNKSFIWILEQHGSTEADYQNMSYQERPVLHLRPRRIDGTDWHLQLNHRNLHLRAGQTYTVTFMAAADQSRTITASVGQAHEPWSNLGFWQDVQLAPELKRYRFMFTANADDNNGRLNFAFGGSDIPLYLTDVAVQPGFVYNHNPAESLTRRTVRLDVNNAPGARLRDRLVFLAEVEKKFFDQMRSYVRNDLDYQGLVTGTIVFGPLGLYGQSDMDYIDTHAYWQHPRFPGRPWDMSNWTVEQQAMTDHPEESPLFNLTAAHLHGKPFTVSEYNHPAPNDYQAESVPMIAAFAAAQDFDGVWLYTYTHTNDAWDRDTLNQFFDINSNPAKWGFVPAGARLFRDGILPSNSSLTCKTLGRKEDCPGQLAELYFHHERNLLAALGEADAAGRGRNAWLNTRQSASLCESLSSAIATPASRLTWNVNEQREGVFAARSDQALVLTGHAELLDGTISGRPEKPAVTVNISSPRFVALTVTALDERPLAESWRILVTACGRAENQEMAFSTDRRTVGTNWGHGPVQIEAVSGTVQIPGKPFTVRPLNPDGTAKAIVAVSTETLKLDPAYATMHYLLTREP